MLMMTMAENSNPYHKAFCYMGIYFNLFLLFGGILKNPGIPQIYIDRLLKEQMGKGEKEQEEEDEESGAVAKSQKVPSSDEDDGENQDDIEASPKT